MNDCAGSQFMCLTVKPRCNLKSYTAADSCVILHGETIVKISNFVQNESGIYFVGQQFKVKKNLFDSPIESSRLGIYVVHQLAAMHYWPVSRFKSKAVMIPVRADKCDSFAVFPLLLEQIGQ